MFCCVAFINVPKEFEVSENMPDIGEDGQGGDEIGGSGSEGSCRGWIGADGISMEVDNGADGGTFAARAFLNRNSLISFISAFSPFRRLPSPRILSRSSITTRGERPSEVARASIHSGSSRNLSHCLRS